MLLLMQISSPSLFYPAGSCDSVTGGAAQVQHRPSLRGCRYFISRSCLALHSCPPGQPQVSAPPVGQDTHGRVDRQLYQSLGGEQQPHADVFVGEEPLPLRAAVGPGGAAGGGLRRAAAPGPVFQLRGADGARDGQRGVVKIGEHGGERRNLQGWRSRLSPGWDNGAVGSFVFCCIEEGGDDRYWKKRQRRD